MIYLFKYVKATARQYTDTVWPHIILTTSLGTLYFQQFIQIGISRWHASSACHLPLYSPVDAEGGRSGERPSPALHGQQPIFPEQMGHPLAHLQCVQGARPSTGSRESLCKAPQRIARGALELQGLCGQHILQRRGSHLGYAEHAAIVMAACRGLLCPFPLLRLFGPISDQIG